jgi:osmotically-inducible protein OsmY
MKTDLEIQKNVMEELKWEPFLKASEIGVAVKNGVVTLNGTVDSYSKKISAEKAAKRVLGVKAVAEDIEVKLGIESKKNDTEIAETILKTLKWHSAIAENKIKIKVENGWVSLDGEAEWEFQKNAAKTAIEGLSGVLGIFNNIKIKPTIVATDIKQKINAAFLRSATIDSEKVMVNVIGSKVILSGKVKSYSEKKEAENAAWFAPGVSQVDSQIEIDDTIFAY